MSWTKELPTESGFYWFRDPDYPDWLPEVVEFEINGPMGTTITKCGNEIGWGGCWSGEIDGEFWPIKLTPPK